MPNIRVVKAIFYVFAITFHLVLLFTNVGNYVHGGTLAELLVLQAAAVLIVAAAIKLLPKIQLIEKIFVALCAVVPVISIVWVLISALGR